MEPSQEASGDTLGQCAPARLGRVTCPQGLTRTRHWQNKSDKGLLLRNFSEFLTGILGDDLNE